MTDATQNPENVIPRRRASDWAKPPTSPKNTLVEHPDGSVTLSGARQLVCLQAAWELDALADILPGIVSDSFSAHLAVRGIAARICTLSQVLMSGLSDDLKTQAGLERDVFGAARREAA